MAATSGNFLAGALKELGWSYTKLIAELRREAAVDGIVLPKIESLIQLISRWANNHQQPDDFYRDLLSRATGRPRYQLFSDEAATVLRLAGAGPGIAASITIGSDEDMNRRQLLARAARSARRWRLTRSYQRHERAMPSAAPDRRCPAPRSGRPSPLSAACCSATGSRLPT
jgi:hypothetical protein